LCAVAEEVDAAQPAARSADSPAVAARNAFNVESARFDGLSTFISLESEKNIR
jgi:hypothetical protein